MQFVGDRHQSRVPCQHHLGVAAIARGADNRLSHTQLELAAPTRLALVAVTAQPADTDALSDLPSRGNIGAASDDASDDFVTRHPRRLRRLGAALDVTHVCTAHAAGFDGDEHFAILGLGRVALRQRQCARAVTSITREVALVIAPLFIASVRL